MRLPTAVLPIALLLAPVVTQAQPGPPPFSGTRLEVVAEGEVRTRPDLADVSAGVVTQAVTASAAMRDNAARMSAVIVALKKAGVADRDIQTSSLSLQPQYRYKENMPPELTGYQASNQVQVTFRDLSRAGSIIDVLVAQGANQINGPNFRVDKPDGLLDQARQEAVTKARARADLYAKAAGLRVKRFVSISEAQMVSPPYPMPVMRAQMAEAKADTAIEPGETRLGVTLSVIFELE